jgi:hypothetical protein
MKKSELRQIIREEIQVLREGSTLFKGKYVEVYANGIKELHKFIRDGFKSSNVMKKNITVFVKNIETGKPVKLDVVSHIGLFKGSTDTHFYSFTIKYNGEELMTTFGPMSKMPTKSKPLEPTGPDNPEKVVKNITKDIATVFDQPGISSSVYKSIKGE